MSLTAAMLIGRSALTASQLGIQVSGNNIANVGTPGYNRQLAYLEPVGGSANDISSRSGRGVSVRDVRRQIDSALQNRLNNGVADESAASQQLQTLSSLESTLGELSGNDFTGQMQSFFNVWSERANLSKSSSVVVQQATKIAEFLRRTRSDVAALRTQIDAQLSTGASRANELLESISKLNLQVANSEAGQGIANSLRDQRDQAVSELSKLVDLTVIDQPNGTVNILIGSTPVILAGQTRGIKLELTDNNGTLEAALKTTDNGETLPVQSGKLGALLSDRKASVDQTAAALDNVASQLIYQVNKLHSTGTNKDGLTSAIASLAVATSDRTLSLNDPTNNATNKLPFKPTSGGFYVTVKQNSTGASQTVRVNVDLDGVNNLGLPGYTNDTTPENIRAALAAVPGLTATFDAEGKLKVDAQTGFSFSFSDDTSGALAVLGVNSFFTGSSASDINVRADIQADPSKLQVGRMVDGKFVENATALELAKLQSKSLSDLQNRSIVGAWSDTVQGVGVATAAAKTAAGAASAVKESLDAQRSAVSGVSLDEESLNLLNYQRQYQAGARLIDVSNQLLQTLMQLV
ncbi:MAG: flagellar hook-associated protein FlgK [Phycisphaerales bacterium]|nr:flagellar hook-associated protein FlgK [Phycisphaerales bacterium]